ncbi:pseudaminic acid synthase [Pseudoalteromonas distincta]|uniref:pseudaminic acid synthase n=1 Tax=Pseudoalteromonas distincta TaxID=77608 RepID=UPI001197730A|nr:pseudaminic acid synthase [Pseudoalteromonas elyakovii]TVU76177.1 pseudaminic acid synthase [Pseudoalteromonas elyakovii]|tara:strand:- start:144 stop:1181 length:1038 start_codon:yes stop_codon:yes gene_type:complete
MKIANKSINPTAKPYIIAEMSGNHNGDINRAIKLIEAAAIAGADAVKLQTYTADTITLNSEADDFKVTGGLWDGYTLYELYDWAHTPWDWHPILFEKAAELNIDIFSSPFDATAVDFLESLNVPAYKIASFELVDLSLIKKVAETGKPIIMSTGMANLDEIKDAVSVAKQYGSGEICVLHCISGYPTPPEQSNLLTINKLQTELDVPIGLSDHTLGNTTAIAATALGACVIEKHFTLCRDDGGPDAAFSLEPTELAELCRDVKSAWQSLGEGGFEHKEVEKDNVKFRRSLYACKNIKKGELITQENIKSVRPGFGLPPKDYDSILGKVAKKDIPFATPLSWPLLE